MCVSFWIAISGTHTPTAFHIKARGREAHPGYRRRPPTRYPNGVEQTRVEPRWGRNRTGRDISQRALSRRWALLCNPVGVCACHCGSRCFGMRHASGQVASVCHRPTDLIALRALSDISQRALSRRWALLCNPVGVCACHCGSRCFGMRHASGQVASVLPSTD